jgi:hypothetical protein
MRLRTIVIFTLFFIVKNIDLDTSRSSRQK